MENTPSLEVLPSPDLQLSFSLSCFTGLPLPYVSFPPEHLNTELLSGRVLTSLFVRLYSFPGLSSSLTVPCLWLSESSQPRILLLPNSRTQQPSRSHCICLLSILPLTSCIPAMGQFIFLATDAGMSLPSSFSSYLCLIYQAPLALNIFRTGRFLTSSLPFTRPVFCCVIITSSLTWLRSSLLPFHPCCKMAVKLCLFRTFVWFLMCLFIIFKYIFIYTWSVCVCVCMTF